MKIKFINVDTGQEIENLKELNNIYLSSQNPRYTTLKSLDGNLMDLIKEVKKSQDDIKTELLSYESDFSHLKNLLDSIFDIGFDTAIEPILLVWNDEIKKYVVAEGNRRTMCLKLILEEFNMNKMEDLEPINNSDITDSDDDDDNNYFERRKGNYKYILEILKKIREKYDSQKVFDVHIKVIENDVELWRLIYTKHIAGKRPGMREWNRGKYFTDILSLFKEGIKINDETFKKVRTLLQREPNTILEDFKHAQFVKEVMKRAKIYSVSVDEVTDNMIFEKMKNIKVSALQSNFSLNRVRVAAKEILDIDLKVFEEKFLKITFDDMNIINFDVETKKNEILNLIYSNYRKGIITTRPIKKEDKYSFNLEVKNILTIGEIDTKKEISSDKLEEMDSFDFTSKKLNEIIEVAKTNNNVDPLILERYETTKKIKDNDNALKKVNKELWNIELKLQKPQDIFMKLNDQYFHNSKNEKVFLNAMASTIRSILEQIIIWSAYYVDDIVGGIIEGNDNLEIKREKYIDWLAKSKVNKIFFTIRNNHFNIVDINSMLNSMCLSNMENESKFIFKKRDEINSLLNEFIHASHRIYMKSKFNDNLKKFSEWQKNIISIISKIDIEKINNLSEKIFNILE